MLVRQPMNFGVLCLALVLLSLSGCGGGGGGGSSGGTAPPSLGPVIGSAAEYWVDDPNAVWLFEGQDNAKTFGSKTYRNRITVGAPFTLAGRSLVPFLDTLPFNDPALVGPQYRSLDGDGIRIFLEDVPTTVAQSYTELPTQIRQGSYVAYEQTVSLPGGTETLQIVVNVIGFETLTLPAGVFRDALKVQHLFNVTEFDDIGELVGAATTTFHFWYAKGIGLIKVAIDDPSASPSLNTQVEELAGVMLPSVSVKAGVVGEFILLDNLASGSSNLTTGRPGVASDGNGYLVAARKYDGTTAQIVATYLNGDGRSVWSKAVIDQSGVTPLVSWFDEPVSTIFDGTNFWIVAKSSAQYGQTEILRQRVSPSGVLADSNSGVLVTNGFWPVLATNGSSVLLVYARFEGTPINGWILYSVLYDANGTVVRAEQSIGTLDSALESAAIAVNGGQYLVTYATGMPYAQDLRAVRIDSTGTVVDTTPIAVSTAAESQNNCTVAPWGANDFVSIWADARQYGFQDADVVGTRISGSGILLDGPPNAGGVVLHRLDEMREGTASATGARGTLIAWTSGSFANPLLTNAPTGIFGRMFSPGSPFAVSDPTAPGTLIGLVTENDFSVQLKAPAASANGAGHLVVWVYNSNDSLAKSIRGSLIFPPYASP